MSRNNNNMSDEELKASKIITLAENKATSLIESAAKDAANLIEIARLNAVKLLGENPPTEGAAVAEIRGMAKDISYIQRDLSEIKVKLDRDYVTMDMFIPVRNIVYGLMATLGLATLGAIFKLIFIA